MILLQPQPNIFFFSGHLRRAFTVAAVLLAMLPMPVMAESDPHFSLPVPNQSNFTLVGTFNYPGSYQLSANDYCAQFNDGCSTAFSYGGLAYRWVNGQLHFFTPGHAYSGGQVYEYNFPGIGNTATVLRNWGDIYGGYKCDNNATPPCGIGNGFNTYGLYYNPANNRLYWTAGDWYAASHLSNASSIGYATLDDSTGVATGVGQWSLVQNGNGISEKITRSGMFVIPGWFANSYTNGMTLAACCGGYYSIASIGPNSLGPTGVAFTEPTGANANQTALNAVVLVNYPWFGPERANRDPNYIDFFDGSEGPNGTGSLLPSSSFPTGWDPQYPAGCAPTYPSCDVNTLSACDPVFPQGCNLTDGVGKEQWTDYTRGAAWIDTPKMSGLVYITKSGTADELYYASDLHSWGPSAVEPIFNGSPMGATARWRVYAPKDLASVATSQKQYIQPATAWVTPELITNDNGGFSGEGMDMFNLAFVPGMNCTTGVQDTTLNGCLFVMDVAGPQQGVEYPPIMYVYAVCNPDGSGCGGGSGAVAPSSASISASSSSVNTGVSVSFMGNAQGSAPLTYTWNFGDGSTGSGATASHAYSVASTYTVTLTVSNSAGSATASATETVTTVSTINAPASASIVANPASGTAPLAVNFTGSASGTNLGTLTYSWVFGDNTTGSGATPSHKYSTAGTYNVTLVVSNSAGNASANATIKTVAPNLPPTASFTATPTSGTVPLAVAFDASASSDPNSSGSSGIASIASYAWNFGDGSTGTGVKPSHTYSTAGTYTVTLAVTDALGLISTNKATATITVTNPNLPPTASFTDSVTNLTIAFNASGSRAPQGSTLTYAWNFGDGSNGTGVKPSHTYSAVGTYTVTLTVTDALGLSSTTTNTVTTTAPVNPLTVSASASVISGNVPVKVGFTAAATDTGGTIKTYSWSFGDSTTSTAKNPTHTYTKTGSYTAKVTVTDSKKNTASSSIALTVNPPVPPTANPTWKIVKGLQVAFTANATAAVGTTIASRVWNFGDGSKTTTGATVTHTYKKAGTYNVTFTVTDNYGGSVTKTVAVTVP